MESEKVCTPTMPLSDIKLRNLKPREKAYKVGDFEGLFILVKVSGAKPLWTLRASHEPDLSGYPKFAPLLAQSKYPNRHGGKV